MHLALMSVRDGERTAESVLPGSVWNWIVQIAQEKGCLRRELFSQSDLEGHFPEGRRDGEDEEVETWQFHGRLVDSH